MISTSSVDKVVDKRLLTSNKARNEGLFDKMHNPKAKIKVNKINDLHTGCPMTWAAR
jgi:hypothetical protein